MEAGKRPRRRPSWLIPILGYALSIGCLVWVYHGVDWNEELARLREADWRWISLAIVFDLIVYFCQAVRWSVLLSPLGPISLRKTTQAIYIGLFANEVLPLRSGEIIRCYLQRRWTGLPLSVVFSSALIERLMDGAWLILGFWIVSGYVQLPGLLVQGSRVLLGILIVAVLLFAFMASYEKQTAAALGGGRWSRLAKQVGHGARIMGGSPSFWLAALLSLAYLVLQVFPIYFVMRGYNLDLGFSAAVAVMVILRLGTIVPNAPGNVGTFQALAILAVGLFGVPRAESAGFATLLFLCVTMPLWFGGFVALLATRMRLEEIHRDAQDTFDAEEDAPLTAEE